MGAEEKPADMACMIRWLRREEAAAMTRILRGAPEAAEWSEESFGEALSWSGGVALVSETEGMVTGFLIGRRVEEDAEILNLGVVANARRTGQGSALLTAALEEFRKRGVSRVFLEVRESNAAGIAFYAKHGFTKTGKRLKYYREPDEAALVMERKLTSQG
jgi:[ribosomal protein S18]-alanine N-acetyltransferase